MSSTPFARLPHLQRYVRALRVRSERASLNPAKDQERSRLIATYCEALHKLAEVRSQSELFRSRLREFRWMVEEFKVSVFAQELGTSIPVSPKRLDEQLAKIREAA